MSFAFPPRTFGDSWSEERLLATRHSELKYESIEQPSGDAKIVKKWRAVSRTEY